VYILRAQLFSSHLGKHSPNYLYKMTKIRKRAIVFVLVFRDSFAISVCILEHFIVADQTIMLIMFGG